MEEDNMSFQLPHSRRDHYFMGHFIKAEAEYEEIQVLNQV